MNFSKLTVWCHSSPLKLCNGFLCPQGHKSISSYSLKILLLQFYNALITLSTQLHCLCLFSAQLIGHHSHSGLCSSDSAITLLYLWGPLILSSLPVPKHSTSLVISSHCHTIFFSLSVLSKLNLQILSILSLYLNININPSP